MAGARALALLLSVGALFAAHISPADGGQVCPEALTELQPDDQPITLYIRGNEYYNWHEDTNVCGPTPLLGMMRS